MHPMQQPRPLAQRALRGGARLGGARLRCARLGGFAGFALVVAATLASGCLVSFDGYKPLDAGGSDSVGATSSSGDATSGGKTGGGGSSSSGKSSGGTSSSGAGATDPLGGAGADAGGSTTAGSATGGSAGSAMGGKAGAGGAGGSGGTTGGNGGSAGASGGSAGKGGTGGTSGSAGTSGAGGGTSGAGGGGGKTCPVNLLGPPMIEIPKPAGGIYCMDRTEVTNEDYQAFLDAAVATSGQSQECTWNDTYAPDTTLACTTAQGAFDPVGKPRVPVSCVDWCDAKRYCGWAGKRLCGAISGGANPPGSYIDANTDQWYRACSKAGTLKFPYGNTYQPSYCSGLDRSGVHLTDVASAPACIGGYAGLYDLSGSVSEWEDSCSAVSGANDNCLIRGGSIQSAETTVPSLLCNDSMLSDATPMAATAKRNSRDEMVGLRCCYDP